MTVEPPYLVFAVRVRALTRLTPSFLRITFTGDDLDAFADNGVDQRIKVLLPGPGGRPYDPTPANGSAEGSANGSAQGSAEGSAEGDWYENWRALPDERRNPMRTYTVRNVRADQREVDVDFVLHGDLGPASRWAQRAVPGDRVAVLAPFVVENGGVDFRPPHGTDWVLITADETALPAVANILTWLPPGTAVKVWIEVPHPEDRIPLPTKADAEVTWLIRGSGVADRTTPLLTAVSRAALPQDTPYAWIAGEAACVRALRRHLVNDRGFDRKAISFMGYWRQGATEDDLLTAAVSEAADKEKVNA
jgi:NADPH-dependent ferric siderophore reductase